MTTPPTRRVRMSVRRSTSSAMSVLMGLIVCAVTVKAVAWADSPERAGTEAEPIRCANLIYGRDKTSSCFSAHFMADAERRMSIRTEGTFRSVRLESDELFDFPFAVMTGEGAFTLTDAQRKNLRRYVLSGGFLVASAGCSNQPWIASFRRELAALFPDLPMRKLEPTHRIFHTVYDIDRLSTKQRGYDASLEALEIEGRVAVVFAPDGLNDTADAGGDCCCCGGNEVLDAEQLNVNLLAYALTH